MPSVTPARARIFGWRLFVLDVGIKRIPTIGFHQLQIDASRRLLARGHGIRNVGRTRYQIASGIEPRTTGFQREPIHFNGSTFSESQA